MHDRIPPFRCRDAPGEVVQREGKLMIASLPGESGGRFSDIRPAPDGAKFRIPSPLHAAEGMGVRTNTPRFLREMGRATGIAGPISVAVPVGSIEENSGAVPPNALRFLFALPMLGPERGTGRVLRA